MSRHLQQGMLVQMAVDKVDSETDFKWESQLRYYWEHHEAPPSGVPPQVHHPSPPHLVFR